MPSKPGKQNEKVHSWGVFIIVKNQFGWQLLLLFQFLQTTKYLQMNLLHSLDLIIISFNFFKLERLEIWNRVGQDHEFSVCQGTLKQLLWRSPLNYLHLQRIANLTDDLLFEVLKANPLLTLRTVFINYCHNVTGRFFWALLEQPNTLEGEKFHPEWVAYNN